MRWRRLTALERSFTKAILDQVMQTGYQNGANFRHVSVSPYVKSVFVTFMSDANVAPLRYVVSQGGERNTIVATADYYEGPFGTMMTTCSCLETSIRHSPISSISSLRRR